MSTSQPFQPNFKYLFPWTRFHSVGFLESFYINCQTNCWKPLFFVLPRSNLKCYSTPFLRTGNPNFSFSPKGPESSLSNFTFIPQKINKEVFLIIIQSCQYTIISPLLFTLLFFLLIFYSPYANIGCYRGLQARCTISIFPRKHTHIDTHTMANSINAERR